MHNLFFLGKPPANVQHWMETHEPVPPTPPPAPVFDGDIFTKYDGTVVKVPYDESKTTININVIDGKENVKHFDFGKSYTDIYKLNYNNSEHGIDLSRTSIDSITKTLDLYSNKLTSFQLPTSLKNFGGLDLTNNRLSCIQLPTSLKNFGGLDLNDNRLSCIQLPQTLEYFQWLGINHKQYSSTQLFILDMTLFDDPDTIPNILNGNIYSSDGDIYQGYIRVKNEVMFNAFKAADKWKDFADSQYAWEGK